MKGSPHFLTFLFISSTNYSISFAKQLLSRYRRAPQAHLEQSFQMGIVQILVSIDFRL